MAAALSIPKVSGIVNQTKVLRAAQAVQLEVQQAYAIAGRNRSPVTLRWSNSSVQLQVTNLAGTVTYRRLSLGTGGGYGLAASEVTMTPSSLVVFPNGLAADSLVIVITRGPTTRKVRVSRSGMVR